MKKLTITDPKLVPVFEATLVRFDVAVAARESAKRNLVLARTIATDGDLSAEVAFATDRMRAASARVDEANEEIARIFKKAELHPS